MYILLFGGSFNPPHLGHAIVIRQAFELIPSIDELWLLPTYNHAFGKDLAPATRRLEMCKLFLQDINIPKTKICSLEIDKKTSGSTYESLQLLQQQYPQNTFSFLMGSDQLPSFSKWHNYHQLLTQMPFYIYPRANHNYPISFPHMTLLTSPTQVITNISSTLIRHRLNLHLPIDHLLSPAILNYINSHHLYSYDL